jgi:hypothetical protein
MIARFGIMFTVLVIAANAASATELPVIHPKRGPHVAHRANIGVVARAEQPQKTAATCNFGPLCWGFGRRADNR